MKKTRKRILWAFLAIVIVLIGVGASFVVRSKLKEDWYRKKLSEADLAKNFGTARDKLVLFQNWAQDNQAWATAGTKPTSQRVNTDPTTPPPNTKSITLSEDELNAILDKHEKDLLAKYGQYITDPYIAIHDGRLVLAITLKDGDRPLSVHVEPKLDDEGKLILRIDHLQLGRVTVPRALWGSYLDKLAEQLAPKVEQARQGARMDADGLASADAVSSGMSRLLLNSLKDKGSDPILFLPADPSHMERGYPVKLTAVKVGKGEDPKDRTLSLTMTTLNKQQQDQLLARLRAPLGEEPEPTLASLPRP
jgi:hypothetical protein